MPTLNGGNKPDKGDAMSSPESEHAICGCIVHDPAVIEYTRSRIEESDFFTEECRTLYTHLVNLHDAGKPVSDISLVRSHLRSAGVWDAIGGAVRLAHCGSAGIQTHVEHYCDEILRTSRIRSLLSVLADATGRCKDVGNEIAKPDEIAEWIDARIASLEIVEKPSHIVDAATVGAKIMGDLLMEEINGEVSCPMISTGVDPIDLYYSGVMAPNYIAIAALPGGGKSAIAKQIANHMSQDGRRVLFVSLEMSADEVCHRIWAERCGINGRAIAKNKMSNEEKLRLDSAIRAVDDEKFLISTPTGKDARFSRIAATARLMASTQGLDAIFIDYIQLLEEEYRGQKAYDKVTDASRRIKQLARELNIPIFVLSQFNSEGESADHGSGPKVSNMRDSRAMGQDADTIWFLVPTKPDSTDIDLFVKKSRGDVKQKFEMHLDGPHTRLVPRICDY